MSKQTEALKLALEALEESLGYVQEEAENAQRLYGQYPARQARIQGLKDDARKHMDAITAIREALAEQPAQQQCMEHGECFGGECIYPAPQPAQQQEPSEYVQKVIDALYENSDPVSVEAAELLEQMTQQQEPVAWMLEWTFNGEERGRRLYDDETHCVFDAENDGGVCRPLYTSPPASKPWVGLTDVEWQEIDASLNGKRDLARIFVRAIEAKLREKNA